MPYIESYEIILHHPTPMVFISIDMLEKEVEEALVKAVKQLGGICWKFTSPGTSGVPDRLCLFVGGKVGFVECKAPGKTLRPLQEKRKRQIEKLGFKVYILDSKEKIQEVINGIQSS